MSTELRVILSVKGEFEDLVDADGNSVAFLVEEQKDAEEDFSQPWHAVEAFPDKLFDYCGFCEKTAVESQLAKCSGCNTELYCIATDCQQKHWQQEHSADCAAIAQDYELIQQSAELESLGCHKKSAYEEESDEEIAAPRRGGRGGRGFRRGRPGWRARRRFRRARFGPWRRRFYGRRWWRPALYPWFNRWNPLWPFVYATDAYLYAPRSVAVDPDWYFDPMAPPQQIDRKLRRLRRRYYNERMGGLEIVPDFDEGRFRWVRRNPNPAMLDEI